MKLSVIILSYNTAALTSQCLDSLVRLTDLRIRKDFEVIVVDNNSSDNSVTVIKNQFPKVKLVASSKNLGFSRGNNLGLQYITPETPYILFLNSDTAVPNGTLSAMLSLMVRDNSIGVATCKVMLWNNKIDMDCHRGFPTPWVALTRLTELHKLFPHSRLFNRYFMGWEDMNSTHEIDSAVGAFMLIPRTVGEKIGWWDEDYFLNGEDIDFCYRVKQLGFKVIYHPEATITHYRGASKGTRKESKDISQASSKTKQTVTTSGIDAMGLFYRKHLKEKYPNVVNRAIETGLKFLRWARLRKLGLW
ncbi:glycosyltransferase family 2 protein [Patescibacteria group bacterium]|nr:glycosyltransferase family 2 protein [Patescibacteria group bacterium]